MNLSQTVSRSNGAGGERRAWPRETLKDYVVLVFFEQDNWGKLTEINQGGMSFEFDRAPSFHRGLSFTFQVMGCTSVSRASEMFGKSLQAVGDIMWVREFERMAGVQFTELPRESWDQIRGWLPSEPPARTPAFVEAAEQESPAASSQQLFVPLTQESENPVISKSEALAQAVVESASPRLAAPLEVPDPQKEVEPRFEENAFDARMPETWVAAPQFEKPPAPVRARAAQAFESDPQRVRPVLALLGICLAAVAVAAGARLALPLLTTHTDTVEHASDSALKTQEPVATSYKSPSDPDRPFQVLVSDLNGKNLLLSFVRGGSRSAANHAVSSTTAGSDSSSLRSVNSSSVKKAGAPGALKPDEKQLTEDKFVAVTPEPTHPLIKDRTANEIPTEAAVLPGELAAPVEAPSGSFLNYRAVPPPPAEFPRTGGEVQQARLIKSAPPVYPAIARSNRIMGDVLVDALIDTAGHVTTVKVVSGPVMLRQAAVQALRQWKYEPARLDGQPVAMHLSLIVKFRLD